MESPESVINTLIVNKVYEMPLESTQKTGSFDTQEDKVILEYKLQDDDLIDQNKQETFNKVAVKSSTDALNINDNQA